MVEWYQELHTGDKVILRRQGDPQDDWVAQVRVTATMLIASPVSGATDTYRFWKTSGELVGGCLSGSPALYPYTDEGALQIEQARAHGKLLQRFHGRRPTNLDHLTIEQCQAIETFLEGYGL